MSRIGAAALALVITAVLFGLGFAGAAWLTGPLVAISGHAHKGIAEAVAIFTGPIVGCFVVIGIVFERRRAEEEPRADYRHLPSASERFQKQVRVKR